MYAVLCKKVSMEAVINVFIPTVNPHNALCERWEFPLYPAVDRLFNNFIQLTVDSSFSWPKTTVLVHSQLRHQWACLFSDAAGSL